ncbi:MAG: hypothetical protein AAGJ28_04940 [Pseudomonadota bacterium]
MSLPFLLFLIVGVTTAIIAFGVWAGNRISSPQDKALTSLISAHKMQNIDEQAAAMDRVLDSFGLGPAHIACLSADDRQARIGRALANAKDFDSVYKRYHWGIRSADLISAELARRGYRPVDPD